MVKIKSLLLLMTTGVWFSGCIADYELKIDPNTDPESLNDEIVISTPAAEGFNESALQEVYNRFFSEDDLVTARSLLVLRNNRLVAEGYCRDLEDRDIKQNIQSATKSITSLVFGIAMEQGYFPSLDQKLYDIMPDLFDDDPSKREITLYHLMTMRSGLSLDNYMFGKVLHNQDQRDHLSYLLSLPLYADPGTEFWYRDCDPQLLAGAITQQTNQTLEEIAEKYLFGPMGITDYYWEKNADGYNWAAQALYMRPRDLAKIGMLMLNKGTWKDQQLVSEEWIDLSTSFQVEFNIPDRDMTSIVVADYGLYWWVYDSNYPRLPEVAGFAAIGSGGQVIFVAPEFELVIVMTCEPYVDGEINLERAFDSVASSIISSLVS